MNVTKASLQSALVIMWAFYSAAQILSNAGGSADGGADPTGGAGLLVGFLETLPVEALVLPTAVMAGVFLAIEGVFYVLGRAGRH